MSDITRREILAIITRLSSLGLLETVRPVLMRDSQFAELLAQQPGPPKQGSPASGTAAAPMAHGVAALMSYLQSNAAEIAQQHQRLSGMVFGAGFGVWGNTPGFQFSLTGSAAVSADLESSSPLGGGVFVSPALTATNGKGFSFGYGRTFFIGQGNLSGMSGSSTGAQAGPFGVTFNQQLQTVSYSPGGHGVSISVRPANTTVQIAGGSPDLAAPFGAFYDWLNGLIEHDWFPYSPPEPFPYVPDE